MKLEEAAAWVRRIRKGGVHEEEDFGFVFDCAFAVYRYNGSGSGKKSHT